MRKIFFIMLLLLSNCGFEPIYTNKNILNLEFKKISLSGENNINEMIIRNLNLKLNQENESLNEIKINSVYNVNETLKSSQGIAETLNSSITVNLSILDNKDLLTNKTFSKNFSYNNKNNKFELVSYQNEIKLNLINEIVKEIILFLNTK